MKIKSTDLFYIYLYLNVFCKGIGLNNDSKIYFAILILGTFAIFFKIISNKYTRKELLFIGISGVIGIANFIFTRRPTLLLTVICLAGMKNVDLDRAIKGSYQIRLITFLSMIILSLTGIIENKTIVMWRIDHFDVRYSLGFLHPNTLHLSLFILISLYIYINFDKLKWYNYLLLMLVNIYIYSFSLCRTGFLLICFMIFLTLFVKRIEIFKKIVLNIPNLVLILMIALSFATGMLYNKLEIMSNLDTVFNGRIAYANYFLTNYRISLFGQNEIVSSNAILDNGYILLYIHNGLLGLLFILYLIVKINRYVKKEKDVKKAILVVTFLIYLFVESFAPNIFMNIILLFVAPLIFKKDKIIKNIN